MKAIDKKMLVQKFSDYYCDETKNEEAKQFELYGIEEIYYPYLVVRVNYQAIYQKKIHQIELKILEIIELLSSTKYENLLQELKKITQLDDDIFDSIISKLSLKGYISINPLYLTPSGKELKNTQKENIQENTSVCIKIDSLIGEMQASFEKIESHIKPPKESMELKPKLKFEPNTQSLNEIFRENKTLRTCLIESVKSIEVEKEIWDIVEVERVKKIFDKMICLFYQYENEERILVVNSSYEKDEHLTQKLERLHSDKLFEFRTIKSRNLEIIKKHKENKQKSKNNLNFEEGANLNVYDFPKYLRFALNNAKKSVCIMSPWVNIAALNKYKGLIEKALQRGLSISIKYGLKSRGKGNKKSEIDKESQKVFEEWGQYDNFHICKGDSHAKVLIFDDEWVIKGSFNWFSFGEDEDNTDVAEEEGLLTRNRNTIQASKKIFNEA